MTGCRRKSLGQWRHGDAVRILEASNQPATGLLCQNLQLNPLARFRHVRWSLCTHHRPSYVGERHIRTQKPHVDVSDGERALGKDEFEAFADFALNLRATPPPPADYVHCIPVFGEQVGVGPCVVPIPCRGLQDLHLANRGFVLLLRHGSEGESHRQHPYYESDSEVQLLHDEPPEASLARKQWRGLAANADLRSLT